MPFLPRYFTSRYNARVVEIKIILAQITLLSVGQATLKKDKEKRLSLFCEPAVGVRQRK